MVLWVMFEMYQMVFEILLYLVTLQIQTIQSSCYEIQLEIVT